jgi:hypothetical protein
MLPGDAKAIDRAKLLLPCVEACKRGDAVTLNELLSRMSRIDEGQIFWELQRYYTVFIEKMLERAIGGVHVEVSEEIGPSGHHFASIQAKITSSAAGGMIEFEIWRGEIERVVYRLLGSGSEEYLSALKQRYEAELPVKAKEHALLLDALQFIYATYRHRIKVREYSINGDPCVAVKVEGRDNIYFKGTFATVLDRLGDPEHNRELARTMVSRL